MGSFNWLKNWVFLFCLFILVGRFVQQQLGAPSVSEYEKLQAEMSDLQLKYNELLAAHQKNCKEVIFFYFWIC